MQHTFRSRRTQAGSAASSSSALVDPSSTTSLNSLGAGPSSSAIGSRTYQLRRLAEATLGAGNLREAVRLPEGENEEEWLAANVADFLSHVNLLYGSVTEYCTPKKCQVMNAGEKIEYYWSDGKEYKKPTRLSAPEYVDRLISWASGQLEDPELFPTRSGVEFPSTFRPAIQAISRRLLRVYVHIYYAHFEQVMRLEMEAHLNTSFKHFLFFVREFRLVDPKELLPFSELILSLTGEPVAPPSSSSS
ncbi:MAG: Mob1/phocein [Piptocephalis tieghemiana]|nr:MAG: Mob1/phocein [Piptocephalis tieghemiana]